MLKFIGQIVLLVFVFFQINVSELIGQSLHQERIERPILSYSTQSYYYEHLAEIDITGTGSGQVFGLPIDIINQERRIESRVEEELRDIQIEPVDIGLIFHILYTNDSRIAESVIQSQLEALNRDFGIPELSDGHVNDPRGEYLRISADTKIKFHLGDVPDTEIELQGVAQLGNSRTQWSAYDAMKDPNRGGSKAIAPDRYLNIWVVDLANELQSYSTSAYFPDGLSGVVLDHRFFGEQRTTAHDYTQGKTLTHLIGSYLGLRELWSLIEECGDDGVSDTPIHNTLNIGCPEYQHISMCGDGEIEMTMNFMDTSDDACKMMFTRGQVERMHAMIKVVYPSLPAQNLSE